MMLDDEDTFKDPSYIGCLVMSPIPDWVWGAFSGDHSDLWIGGKGTILAPDFIVVGLFAA